MRSSFELHGVARLLRGGFMARALRAMFERLLRWQTRAAERSHLAEIDDRMLCDVGISRPEARHEANKPFWRE